MTTTPLATTHPAPHNSALGFAVRDVVTLARRNLLALIRVPTALVFMVIQPVMFVLLFRYIFQALGAFTHGDYVNFLVPGILVQTTIFGAVGTAIGLAEDLQRGLIERFKALPMARMAVLAGRTLADSARNVIVLIIITGVGFLVGFRPHGGFFDYIAACLIMLLFAYCLSWGFAFVGLAAPNSETAQAMTFPLIFPLTFASTIFIPLFDLPTWLQGFANNQPVSETTNAVRALMTGTPAGNSIWVSLLWAIGLIAVLAPLAVNQFRKIA
ncbi:MAG: ABC transporter permease [Acidimicrobiales bacterium]|jgi:ABC-2 type transport system permease protein/oleandomycin transport system permease protein